MCINLGTVLYNRKLVLYWKHDIKSEILNVPTILYFTVEHQVTELGRDANLTLTFNTLHLHTNYLLTIFTCQLTLVYHKVG